MKKEWAAVKRIVANFVNDVSGVDVKFLASVAGQRLSPLTGRACQLHLPFTEGDRPLAHEKPKMVALHFCLVGRYK